MERSDYVMVGDGMRAFEDDRQLGPTGQDEFEYKRRMKDLKHQNVDLDSVKSDSIPVYNVMMLAGETSGDGLAAGLVSAMRNRAGSDARLEFFGAGGDRMKEVGVHILEDMTKRTVFGLSEVVGQYFWFKQIFQRLLDEACERQPDLIILTDYAGFNLRFAEAVRKKLHRNKENYPNWNPRILYYVSPQVWASRAFRVFALSRSVDCILSLFPFEKPWYALRAPNLRVEFVGDPMADRYRSVFRAKEDDIEDQPQVLLLPGSRKQELKRHIPIMEESVNRIHQAHPCRFVMILSSQEQLDLAESLLPDKHSIELRIGGLSEALSQSTLTLACSGTVTRECGYHGVPTIVFYRLAWLTYWIARAIIKVRYIAMPNLLLNQLVYPELIQSEARPDRIADKALQFLRHPSLRQDSRKSLSHLMDAMGEPGAFDRAAKTVLEYLPERLQSA